MTFILRESLVRVVVYTSQQAHDSYSETLARDVLTSRSCYVHTIMPRRIQWVRTPETLQLFIQTI